MFSFITSLKKSHVMLCISHNSIIHSIMNNRWIALYFKTCMKKYYNNSFFVEILILIYVLPKIHSHRLTTKAFHLINSLSHSWYYKNFQDASFYQRLWKFILKFGGYADDFRWIWHKGRWLETSPADTDKSSLSEKRRASAVSLLISVVTAWHLSY